MNDNKGEFLWYELMTTDTEAAKAFYTEVLGWGAVAWDGGEMPMQYTMWTLGEEAVGGLMELPEMARTMGAPPSWVAYVGVPDVDATVAVTRAAGGGVLAEPFDIAQVGRVAMLVDPQGGAFAVLAPEGDGAAPEPPGVGRVSWNELGTSDAQGAWAFYSAIFGWEVRSEMEMPAEHGGGVYRMYGIGDRTFGGISAATGGMATAWLYYIRVADLAASIERATALGARLLNGPMVVPGGDRVAQLLDPQGAAFALHEVV